MNNDIKQLFKSTGVYQWQVAAELGISERTLIVWLRSELSDDKRARIENAVDKLSKGGDTHD